MPPQDYVTEEEKKKKKEEGVANQDLNLSERRELQQKKIMPTAEKEKMLEEKNKQLAQQGQFPTSGKWRKTQIKSETPPGLLPSNKQSGQVTYEIKDYNLEFISSGIVKLDVIVSCFEENTGTIELKGARTLGNPRYDAEGKAMVGEPERIDLLLTPEALTIIMSDLEEQVEQGNFFKKPPFVGEASDIKEYPALEQQEGKEVTQDAVINNINNGKMFIKISDINTDAMITIASQL